jgi:hypothetical protein
MFTRLAAAALVVAVISAGLSFGQESLEHRAAAIRPTSDLVRYQRIPWVLDLNEAVHLAKDEKRPIFFWAAGGRERDGVPLERC